jgi:hypothetical protein
LRGIAVVHMQLNFLFGERILSVRHITKDDLT